MAVTGCRVIGQERPCPLRFTLISPHLGSNPGQATMNTAHTTLSLVKCMLRPYTYDLCWNEGEATPRWKWEGQVNKDETERENHPSCQNLSVCWVCPLAVQIGSTWENVWNIWKNYNAGYFYVMVRIFFLHVCCKKLYFGKWKSWIWTNDLFYSNSR